MSYKLLLKEIRMKRGMTQQEVAEAANMPLSTYRSWEQGVAKKFSLEHAFVLSAILGCTPNDLCGWYESHPEDCEKIAAQPDEAELIANYRACPPKWKATIAMTARAAAEDAKNVNVT